MAGLYLSWKRYGDIPVSTKLIGILCSRLPPPSTHMHINTHTHAHTRANTHTQKLIKQIGNPYLWRNTRSNTKILGKSFLQITAQAKETVKINQNLKEVTPGKGLKSTISLFLNIFKVWMVVPLTCVLILHFVSYIFYSSSIILLFLACYLAAP